MTRMTGHHRYPDSNFICLWFAR